MREPHRFGSVNDAGKELKSNQWSCIDFAVMRQRDQAMCIDVTAKRVLH